MVATEIRHGMMWITVILPNLKGQFTLMSSDFLYDFVGQLHI